MLGYLPASLRIILTVVVGSAVIFLATDGFSIYTTEGKRRSDVALYPRDVPRVVLIDQDRQLLTMADFKGKTVLVEFIFSTCPSFCNVLGRAYNELQKKLIKNNIKNVVLMSISFDYDRDKAEQIKQYASRFTAQKPYWYVVRASNPADLAKIINRFELSIIRDDKLGYEHDSSIHIIDKNNKLSKIVDYDDSQAIKAIFKT